MNDEPCSAGWFASLINVQSRPRYFDVIPLELGKIFDKPISKENTVHQHCLPARLNLTGRAVKI